MRIATEIMIVDYVFWGGEYTHPFIWVGMAENSEYRVQ